MLDKLTVKDADVAGKRVLVRVDFNVPLADGSVTDDTRVRAALPTLRYLVDQGARVIIVSHLGRPNGERNEAYSLRPVRRVLARLLGRNVHFVDDIVGEDAIEAVARMVDGEIIMLQNVRFDPGEKANDPEFARKLAGLADIYVNDAFGAAHRAHASTAGVAEFLPAYAGMLLAREVETLTDMLANPDKPFVAILGGSKVSDKFGVIDRLLDVCDTLIIGGGMCFTMLVAKASRSGKLACRGGVDRAGQGDARASCREGRRASAAGGLRGRRQHRRGRGDRGRRARGDPCRHDGSRYRPDHRRSSTRERSPRQGRSSGTGRWACSR